MKKLFTTALVAIAALSVMALPVSAAVVFDYVGFGWESGPTKAAGDKLSVAAIADGVDAILNIDLGTTEVTFYAYDLVSTGDVIDGFGNTVTGYAGGVLEVYEDTAQDADWGIFPPNFTSPLTFTNGSLLFQGTFVDTRGAGPLALAREHRFPTATISSWMASSKSTRRSRPRASVGEASSPSTTTSQRPSTTPGGFP